MLYQVDMWFVFSIFISIISAQDSYKAAVVEYATKYSSSSPTDVLLENVNEYIKFIEEAANKGAQIIVFPEDGLTGFKILSQESLPELSTVVPDPSLQQAPCDLTANYSRAFIDLSCAARVNSIYTVVNLIEKGRQNEPSNQTIYHNTNVVLDKNGVVVARYRKINLFYEPLFERGNTLSTFKTDFGVTFGMFICFDIYYKMPALDIFTDSDVTDVIFSVAWFSELPFVQGLSVQSGYARANGINFLSSGLNDPAANNGGSGIFLANGTIAETYISGSHQSHLIIQDVPKVQRRLPYENSDNAEDIESSTPEIFEFITQVEDMKNYTFKSLNNRTKLILELVCGKDGHFCCSFNITIDPTSLSNADYVYKLAAFNGVRDFGPEYTAGIRACGLVACVNDSDSTCGMRRRTTSLGVRFETISVRGIFDLTDYTYDQPATLRYDLKPVQGYKFSARPLNSSKIEVTVATLAPQHSVLTFGISGRIYNNDWEPAGPAALLP